jgi:methionine synthase II (cobalamin-independent)
MVKIKGLATGIGSMPHKDADAALDLVFKYAPQIPFWPQLPQRHIREGMVAQFSENLAGVELGPQGLTFRPDEKKLEVFYERLIAQDLDYFKISPEFALGLDRFYARLKKENLKAVEFIKCQVTGPFTFSASINDEKGVALLHNAVFKQAILKGLAMKALWQINLFREFGKKIILFFDEPYLGCFGSAFTPLNREDVLKDLSELIAQVKSPDVLIGVHCCGNTDWSIFTDIQTIDIISFDAFGFLERLLLYAQNLKSFFKRGGLLCWGIVPTQEFNPGIKPQDLHEKINSGVEALAKKGLERAALLNQMLLSASCGLGSLDTARSDSIFKLLFEISQKLQVKNNG